MKYVGKKFNRLTIIKEPEQRNGYFYCLCKCDCGKEHYVELNNLKRGAVKSCGCLRKDNKTTLTHGLSKTRLYKRWKGIKYRCYGTGCSKYYMYGAKGIKMCEEWKNDFMAFYEWSMENGYRDDLTIDRIDYDGDYCPENCRWVDIYVQANNKRNIKRYNYNGENLTLTQLSKKYNVDFGVLQRRVITQKWDIDKALTTPVVRGRNQYTEKNDNKIIEYNGEKISFNELCEMSILDRAIVCRRFNKGWSAEEILSVPKNCQVEKWRKENVLHLSKS